MYLPWVTRGRSFATVLGEDGPLFAVPPPLLSLAQLGGQAANLLLERRQFGVHPGLVKVADTGDLPLDEFDVLSSESHKVFSLMQLFGCNKLAG